MSVPDDLYYTEDHEWVRFSGGVYVVGITDFAQQALGDVVHVELPIVGTVVTTGATLGEIESTKSVSELYAPASGTIVEVNPDIEGKPELVNSDPYGGGWICKIEPSDGEGLGQLLTSSAYAAIVAELPGT